MDRLQAMAAFVAAVEAGSLAAAARKLGCSPASVTRAVTQLEARSGERMLHRSARRLRLTETGERHLAAYRTVLAELAEAEVPGPDSGPLTGTVCLTAPEMFGRLKVMPVVEDFLSRHPGVRARVLFLNRVVSLVEEGVDVAVRLAPLPDSGLVAVRLGEVTRFVCASPSYLDRCGCPAEPIDLQRHDCIGQIEGQERELWHFTQRRAAGNRAVSVAIHPRLALNGAGAAIDAALRGAGLCQVLSYQVADHFAAGRLVPVLAGYEPAVLPVHLVFHPIPRRNAVLRALIDHVTPRLRRVLAPGGSPDADVKPQG